MALQGLVLNVQLLTFGPLTPELLHPDSTASSGLPLNSTISLGFVQRFVFIFFIPSEA
jgi:hypothetical protein